jgi:hypothetical protein
VRQLASTASGCRRCTCLDQLRQRPRTEEKSKSLYLQFNTDWDTAMPIHTAIGVRYEKTDVVSTALVPAPTDIKWVSQNEFPITFGGPTFTTLTGKYNNLLPSFDSDIDLTPDRSCASATAKPSAVRATTRSRAAPPRNLPTSTAAPASPATRR